MTAPGEARRPIGGLPTAGPRTFPAGAVVEVRGGFKTAPRYFGRRPEVACGGPAPQALNFWPSCERRGGAATVLELRDRGEQGSRNPVLFGWLLTYGAQSRPVAVACCGGEWALLALALCASQLLCLLLLLHLLLLHMLLHLLQLLLQVGCISSCSASLAFFFFPCGASCAGALALLLHLTPKSGQATGTPWR